MTKQKTCTCNAYSFPHRLDGGKCRENYNYEAQQEAEYDAYFKQRGVPDGNRQMFESGHNERDFA